MRQGGPGEVFGRQTAGGDHSQNDRHRDKFLSRSRGDRLVSVYFRFAFDAFEHNIEGPGKDHRRREAENQENDHEPGRQVRRIEEWKDLGGDLDDEPPGDDGVSDRRLVNVAALQLGKKLVFTLIRRRIWQRVFGTADRRGRIESIIDNRAANARATYRDASFVVGFFEEANGFVLVSEHRLKLGDWVTGDKGLL